MSFVNWSRVFYIDPTTFNATTSAQNAIAIPTYGNFGGSNYTAGILQTGTGPVQVGGTQPVDILDQLFQAHDIGIPDATSSAPADLVLLQGIAHLPVNQLDAGARLYAGLAALAMIGKLQHNGGIASLSPKQIATDTGIALTDIQSGTVALSLSDKIHLATLVASDTGLTTLFENVGASIHLSGGSLSVDMAQQTHVADGIPALPGEIAYDLYELAFGRIPDEQGLRFWAGSSMPPNALAHVFMTSAEATQHLAQLNDTAFVMALYVDVLDRNPDASGLNFYTTALEHGASREGLATAFLGSSENIQVVGSHFLVT